MRILVTGATGFIGINLCRYLTEQNHEVTGLVRSQDKVSLLNGISTKIGNVVDRASLEEAVKDIDVIINLAALFNHPECSWNDYLDVNVKGIQNILKVARENGVQRVIHCSTVGVAAGGKIPYSENNPYCPPAWDSYETSKCKGEKTALKFYRETNFPVVVIRPAQVYGPGDKSKVKFYNMVKKGVLVNPGNTLKHLIYIEDLCRAFELSLTSEKAVGEVIIIAGEEVTPLKKLIQIVADELKVPKPKWYIPAIPMTILCTVVEYTFNSIHKKPPLFRRSMDFFRKTVHFDNQKAKDILSFQSTVSVQQGVHNTADWYRDNNLI